MKKIHEFYQFHKDHEKMFIALQNRLVIIFPMKIKMIFINKDLLWDLEVEEVYAVFTVYVFFTLYFL